MFCEASVAHQNHALLHIQNVTKTLLSIFYVVRVTYSWVGGASGAPSCFFLINYLLLGLGSPTSKRGSPNGKKSFGLHVYKVCPHIVHFKPNLRHSIHKDSLTSYLKDSHYKSNIPLWVIVICL